MEDTDLFWIAGLLHGRMPLLSPLVREAVDLALIDIAWKAFNRDAGPGDTGQLFSGWQNADHVLLTEDPRAGAVLTWLSSRDGPLRAAARRVHRARGGGGLRFSADERDMLIHAIQASREAKVKLTGSPPVGNLFKVIATLKEDARFASAPPGRSGVVGGTWAINLALATFPAQAPQPGIVRREALRSDLPADRELFTDGWASTCRSVYDRVRSVARRVRDVEDVLASFSKNARARDIIPALAALDTVRRSHIKRGWELSEGGTTLVMRQLVENRVATTNGRGTLSWSFEGPVAPVAEKAPGVDSAVLQEFDEAMALADRLLSRELHKGAK